MKIKIIKIFIYICVYSVTLLPLNGQNIQKIAAVVNDDIISEYDIYQRTKFIAVTMSKKFNQDFYNKTRDRTLEKLIIEKIQIQKSTDLKIIVSEAEILKGIEFIEKQNNMAQGELIKLLQSRAVETNTLKEHIKSNIAWSKLVGIVLRSKIIVTDDEINAKIEMLEGQNNDNKYSNAIVDLKQILLPYTEKNNSKKENLKKSVEIAKNTKGCKNFIELGKKYGQEESLNLGKLKISDTPPNFKEVLQTLEIGKVSKPVTTNQGVHIFMICEKTIINISKQKLKIGNEIGQEKLDALANRYLNDIRREAIIDIR